jgi:hypothetical protein
MTSSVSDQSFTMTTFESSNVREKLNNITECSVCAETYSDPRVLPCIHTYCLKCIKGFSRNKHPGDRVSCPLCRKDFIVPENGIDSLPKNFFIEQLKDLTRTPAIHCEGCDVTEENKRRCIVLNVSRSSVKLRKFTQTE